MQVGSTDEEALGTRHTVMDKKIPFAVGQLSKWDYRWIRKSFIFNGRRRYSYISLDRTECMGEGLPRAPHTLVDKTALCFTKQPSQGQNAVRFPAPLHPRPLIARF